MRTTGVLIRVRGARVALALLLVGSPAWLARAAFAEPPADAPAPPASRRLWPPPPQPRRPAPPAPSTDAPVAEDPTPPAPPAPSAPSPPPQPPAPPASAAPAQIIPYAPPDGAAVPPMAYVWPPGGVLVDLRSDDPSTRIDQVLPAGGTYPVCTQPCRRILWRNATYVIQVDRVPPTSAFMLPDSTNQVTLDVRAGSSSKRTAGMALIIGGGVAGLLGYISALASMDTSSSSSSSSGVTRSNNGTGLALLGIGVTAGIVGIVLLTGSRTSVTSSTGSTFTEAPPKKPRAAVALTPQGLSF